MIIVATVLIFLLLSFAFIKDLKKESSRLDGIFEDHFKNKTDEQEH